MVGYAGSPTYTVYVDVTLTRSKVKVKVTGLLNFRQLEYFLVDFSFFVTLFLRSSVRQIKLAVRQLFGARKYRVSY